MFKLENPELFQQTVSRAIETVQKRWASNEAHSKSVINAISKAVIRIREHGEFISYEPEADRCVIWSQTSNLVYDIGPDGRHGCYAELSGSVCWHLAAKRLLALYAAAIASGEAVEASPVMPYMQPGETRRRERVGGIWI